MSRRCTICRHAALAEIDQELLAGTPHRSVAKQHRLSPSAMFRHLKQHLERAEAELPVEADRHQAERVVALEDDIGIHREAILALCSAVKKLQQGQR